MMQRLLMFLMGIIFFSGPLLAQENRVISGKVTEANGNPISNVSVVIKDAATGTQTNAEGNFSLTVPASAKALTFSSVGFTSKEVTIGTEATINVTLAVAESQNALQEVVVTGYQTLRRSEVTGSVSKVSGQQIAQKPIGSFTQLLQGNATGVQVTGVSGRPGANANIRIRGTGSINAGSDPLIIVDGIAVTSAAYNLLNPNDIEDITVLKDASASSIYGSRAANGVLVVTTRKGRSGKAELRYSFQYGVAKPQDLQNARLMTSQEKLQYEYEIQWQNPLIASAIQSRIAAGTLPAGATIFTVDDAQKQQIWSEVASKGAGDWRKILLRDAITRTHEIAISGGAEKFRYFFSLNKNDNEGVLFGSYWNRTGGRLNVEFQAADWFKIGTNLSVTNTQESQVREPNNTQNLYAASFYYNPYEAVVLANGKYNPTFQGFSALEGVVNNPQVFNRLGSISSVYGEANFFKNLTLRSQLGINYNTFKEEYYIKPGSDLATILGYNSKRDAGNRDFLYTFTNTAQWKQSIASKHNINALLGSEFTKDQFYSYSLTARGFPTASVETLDNASQPNATSTTRSDWALISYFGKATYNFDRKYFLDLSGRRDGSSRFGANNRFANFWAVGLAWDVTKESFFNLPQINSLRLKTSYGTAGNFNIGNYDALGVYALNRRYNDLPAAAPLRLPNPELTWELNRNFDAGVEVGLLNNRITLSADYYNRKTDDLLYGVNVSQTTGFSSYTGNIGNMVNKGYELLLSGDIIKNKDWKWNVSLSYTNNDNKITRLYSDNVPQSLSRLVVGQPLNTFYLVRWAGINPENGKNQFYKADGSVTETYSASDAVLLKGKSPVVKYFGSVTTGLSYKGIDLNAQLYYTGGNYVMNYMWQNAASDGESYNNNQFAEAFNYWKKPGDVVQYANILDASQNVTYTTDKYLQKGDYITLRDVTLGYTLPASIAGKAKLKGLRFFVQGTNLWLGTKFKGTPEIGQANSETTTPIQGQATLYGYPPIKAMTVGVDVRF
jgi:TonB-linked SusC/RagA family outer membrane protein